MKAPKPDNAGERPDDGNNHISFYTNVGIFRSIAEDALAESQRLEQEAKRPKPDGSPGHIITWDPDRKCFKQALIAIVFASSYLDALLYMTGVSIMGKEEWIKKFQRRGWERRLRALGVDDAELLAECRAVRDARNEIAHENAELADEEANWNLRTAQNEAARALRFVARVRAALGEDND